MQIWCVDYNSSKYESLDFEVGRLEVNRSTDPEPCELGDLSGLGIIHTQKMESWVSFLGENEGIFALFVSDDTGGRILSHKDDSVENAYFSVKYKFDTLMVHPLFKDLIEAAREAESTADPRFQSAWEALKDDLVSLEPLVIANVMLSAGLDTLPNALEREAMQAYEVARKKKDPDWDWVGFMRQNAAVRNQWLEEVV